MLGIESGAFCTSGKHSAEIQLDHIPDSASLNLAALHMTLQLFSFCPEGAQFPQLSTRGTAEAAAKRKDYDWSKQTILIGSTTDRQLRLSRPSSVLPTIPGVTIGPNKSFPQVFSQPLLSVVWSELVTPKEISGDSSKW